MSDGPVICDGHAVAWFTERDHLHGDKDCIVCAFLGVKKANMKPIQIEVVTAQQQVEVCAAQADAAMSNKLEKEIWGAEQQGTPTQMTDALLKDAQDSDVFVELSRQLERELSDARAEAEKLREALSFYADDRRYLGPNQRREEGDNWTPEDHPYMVDVSRDRGEIAKAALAATRKEEGNG